MIWELVDVTKRVLLGTIDLLVQIARVMACKHEFDLKCREESWWTGRRRVTRLYTKCHKCGRKKPVSQWL